MDNLRFLSLAAMLAGASFFGVKWLNAPSPRGDDRLPTFHAVDVNSPEEKFEASSIGDNDKAREQLRNAALTAATELAKDPCDSGKKSIYVAAAANYATAWLAEAPCVASNSCNARGGDAQLDRVQKDFGTPLDHRVREAMAQAHRGGAIVRADFTPPVAAIMATLAADPSLNAAAPDGQPAPGQLRSAFANTSSGQANCRTAAR